MSKISLSLYDILVSQFGAAAMIPLAVPLEDLLEFTSADDRVDIDLQERLAYQREIAIIWSIEDVQSVRPDLSDDQAWEVLKFAHRAHDANLGINWECLEMAAENLYGDAVEIIVSGEDGDE